MNEDKDRLQAVATELGVNAEFAWRYNPVVQTEGWHLSALDGESEDEWLGRDVDNAIEAFEARFNRVPYP